MNVLKMASILDDTAEFDLVISSVQAEVPDELAKFITAQEVMAYIRETGRLPNFVAKHCQKVIDEHRQIRLL